MVKAMKIGILTYHRAINYGAYLQACALCQQLNQEAGIEAEIIDFQMPIEVEKYSFHWPILARLRHWAGYRFSLATKKAFEAALNDPLMIRSKEYCQSDREEDFEAFVRCKYDVIIAGSDEIWNFKIFRGFPNS